MAKSNGKTDEVLGKKVKVHLERLGLETVVSTPKKGVAFEELLGGVARFLYNMGLDTTDPSIRATPERVAEMFTEELCYGLDYTNFPKCTTTPNGQDVVNQEGLKAFIDSRVVAWKGQRTEESVREEYANQDEPAYQNALKMHTRTIGKVDEMVMVDTINTISLCEHHFQTISGVSHIAYIPGNNLLGLSKFARVVNFFARRPQVQERMTEQIYAALSFILGTDDIAVQVVATHNCMRARGAMDPHSKTTTSKMGGRFLSNGSLRQEFLMAIPKVTV